MKTETKTTPQTCLYLRGNNAMRLLFVYFLMFAIAPVFTQEFQSVNKNPIENSFNTRYLGSIGEQHFALNFNVNVFRNEVKDIDEDKIDPKTELFLLVFDKEANLQKKVVLDYEYKFQEILFAGIIQDHVSLIYSSKKGKGTIQENFDVTGNKMDFSIFSEEKKKNYIKATASNNFILHITKEDCNVYNSELKNIDKFTFQTDSILEVIDYNGGFLMLHIKDNQPELIQYTNGSLKKSSPQVSKTWVCKSPKISIDPDKPEIFYLTYLIGKTTGKPGGWDFYDTRLDMNYRSKGAQIVYYNGVDDIQKERSLLFESNIVYGTNPNANSEQNMGCTNLRNLGLVKFNNALLLLFEEQTMKITVTVNQLTGTKKVNHHFKYHDIIFLKVGEMTSIQNFLIKACETNMDENQFGSFDVLIKENKLNLLFNQTYIRENKHKLLTAGIDLYLETQDKTLNETFNQHDLNLVLNPTRNYVKSKYFLALQNGFFDLTFLEE